MKIGGYGSNNQNILPYFLFYIYSVGEKKPLTGREHQRAASFVAIFVISLRLLLFSKQL